MKQYLLVVMSAVVVFFGVGTWWYLRFPVGQHEHMKIQTENMNQTKQGHVIYYCPMHPQVRSDQPGSCPICGMDLVIDEEREHSLHHQADESKTAPIERHAEVNLSLSRQQLIGIKLGRVEKKALFKSILAPGRVAFDPELYTAQSEYLEALKQWNQVKNSPLSDVKENTKQMIQSSKIRLKVLGLSDDQILRLTQKGSQSEGLLVTGKGQDNWIYADIFEVDLPFIKKGHSAQINANFLQGKSLAGEVISVDQVIDPNTRTAKVRIQLLENHPSIRPESYVNVTIFAPLGEQVSVPLEAILDTGKEIFVFVKKGHGTFEPRKVRVLLETDSDAAVSSGVSPGEEVVLGGNFMLDSESRLRAVIQGNETASGEHNP